MAHLFHPTSPGDEGESLLQRAWRRYEGSHQHATEALSSYTSGPVGNPIDVNSILSLELDFLEKFALANSNEERLELIHQLPPLSHESLYLFGVLSETEGYPDSLEEERKRQLQRYNEKHDAASIAKRMETFTFRKVISEIDPKQPANSGRNKEILDFLASKVLGIRTEVPSPPSTSSRSQEASSKPALPWETKGISLDKDLARFVDRAKEDSSLFKKQGKSLLFDFRVYNYLRKTDHLDLLADLVGLYGIPVFATQDERKTLLKKAFKSKREYAVGNTTFYDSLTNRELQSLCEGFSVTRRKPILSESKYVNALISRISLAFGVKETDGIIERYIDEILELTVSLLDKNHQLRFMALFTKLTMIKKRTGSPVDGGNLFNEYIHFQRGYDLSNSVESKSQKKDKFIKFRLTDPTAKKYLKMPSVSQDETLLEDGLMDILGKGQEKKIQHFNKIFEEDYLIQLQAEAKILAGSHDVQYWLNRYSENKEKVEQLRKRVELQFADDNPRCFGVQEDVSLKIKVKNIPKLQVSVYELNLPNFYLDKKEELNTDIDLEGLLPMYTETIQSHHSPWVLHNQQISIEPAKSGEMGAFVVEVSGGGKSCRSIVRKGALNYYSRHTWEGIALTVMDGENQMVDPSKLVVDVPGHRIDGTNCLLSENKEMLISTYGNTNDPAVVMVKDETKPSNFLFASLFNFNYPVKDYQAVLTTFLSTEMTVASHQRTPLLLRSRVYQKSSSIPVPYSQLKETSVKVTLKKHSGVETVVTFDHLELSDKEDTELLLDLTDSVTEVGVVLSTKVKHSDGTLTPCPQTYDSHTINSHIGSLSEKDFCLKYFPVSEYLSDSNTTVLKGYRVYYLGRNGEPYGRKTLTITPQLQSNPSVCNQSVDLATNLHGFVSLGELRGFDSLLVSDADGGCAAKTFHLSRRSTGYEFPEITRVREEDNMQLEVPLPSDLHNFGSQSKFMADTYSISLYKTQSTVSQSISQELCEKNPLLLDDFSRRISVEVNEGIARVGKLTRGIYNLCIFDTLRYNRSPLTIKVLVLPREFTQAVPDGIENYTAELVYQASVMRSCLAVETIQLLSCCVEGDNIDNAQLKFNCRYNGDSLLRANVVGTSLEPPADFFTDFAKIGASDRETFPGQFGESPVSTEYVKSRVLHEETTYITSRQEHPGCTGSTLSRPSLLMNPWAVGDAQVEKKEAKAGTSYESRCSSVKEKLGMGRSKKRVATLKESSSRIPFKFLPENASCSFNCKFSCDSSSGNVSIMTVGFPLKAILSSAQCPKTLSFIFTDGSSSIVGTLPVSLHQSLKTTEEHSRDALRSTFRNAAFRPILPPGSHVIRQRQSEIIHQGKVLRTQGTGENSVTEFACLDDVIGFFRTIGNKRIEQFAFLGRWFNLDEESKRKYYSKYVCTEINLFMKRKDPHFFEEFVRRQVAAKRTKTVVDQYLLDWSLSECTSLSFWCRLNSLEKCLVIDWMRKQDSEAVQHAYLLSQQLSQDVSMDDNARVSQLYDKALTQSFGVSLSASDEPLPVGKLPTEELNEYTETNGFEEWSRKADIPLSPLWSDLSAHCLNNGIMSKFLSPNFWRANGSINEQLYVLAVLDLPCQKPMCRKESTPSSGLFEFSCDDTCICMYETLVEVDSSQGSILVGQNYKRAAGSKLINSDEFIPGVQYICEVVVTNIQDEPAEIEIMYQIPEQGSISLRNSFTTRVERATLGGYLTHTIEYSFYFPYSGTYSHYPVHVSSNGGLVAHAYATQLEVSEYEPAPKDTDSWEYVAAMGTDQQVLQFLNDIHPFDKSVSLRDVLWRCVDGTFWTDLTRLLETRQVYFEPIFRLGFRYYDLKAIGTFIAQECPRRTVLHFLEPYFNSRFISVYPEAWEPHSVSSARVTLCSQWSPEIGIGYHHLEYAPLINARSHQLGNESLIRAEKVKRQWRCLLMMLCHKAPAKLSGNDRLALVYHLLLQDRVQDADSMFQLIKCPSGAAMFALGSFRERFPRLGAEHLWSEDVDIPSENSRKTTNSSIAYDYMSAYLELRHKLSDHDLDEAKDRAQAMEENISDEKHVLATYLETASFLLFPVASRVALKYLHFQAPHWKRKFEDVLRQLVQLSRYICSTNLQSILYQKVTEEGTPVWDDSIDSRDRKLLDKQAKSPSLSVHNDIGGIKVTFCNMQNVVVSFYPVDIESLFSKAPFKLLESQDSEHFTFIQPSCSYTIDLSANYTEGRLCTHIEPMPDEVKNDCVIVQCFNETTGREASMSRYANDMNVQLVQNEGAVYAFDKSTNDPLGGVYVKVYRRHESGSTRIEFHKDGYTNVLGKFDYRSQTDDSDRSITSCQFALLAKSTEKGATVLGTFPV